MAGKPLPGHPGVTVYPSGEMPKGSYVLKNPDGSIFQDANGQTYAGQEAGLLTKALPYVVGGMMGYGLVGPLLSGAGGAAAGSGGAAATVATGSAAGGAAAGGGTLAALGLNPISAAILGGSTLANLYGAHQAANASKQASAVQQAGAQKALDFNQMLFGQQQQAFAPYQATGQGAASQLGSLLTGARPPSMPASVQKVIGSGQTPAAAQINPQPLQGASMAQQNPAMGQAPPAAQPSQGALVTMRSPTGETGQVPAAQVQHWLSKGAQVVQ